MDTVLLPYSVARYILKNTNNVSYSTFRSVLVAPAMQRPDVNLNQTTVF